MDTPQAPAPGPRSTLFRQRFLRQSTARQGSRS